MRLIVVHLLICAFSATTSERHQCLETDDEELDDRCGYTSEEDIKGGMFYYNKHTGECTNDASGYCPGRRNRFWSKEECNSTCKDAPRGRCASKPTEKLKTNFFSRWHFNIDLNKCQPFIYDEETGNEWENMFQSKEECDHICRYPLMGVCGVRRNGTSCNSTDLRYWYNDDSQKCEKFQYCSGDSTTNVFETLHACYAECGRYVENDCRLPILNLNCTEYKTVYGFDPNTERCEAYSGCEGYKNSYTTAKKCWQECRGHSSSRCLSAPSYWTYTLGPFLRYYYDIESNTCKSARYFWYSISDGMNRFFSKEDCEDECIPQHKQNGEF